MPTKRNFQIGALRFDLSTRAAWRDNRPVELTRKEFDLALLLLSNLGEPMTTRQIIDFVWHDTDTVVLRSLATHASRIRSKLGLSPEYGFQLRAIYGYGYRLERMDPAPPLKHRSAA